MNILGISAFYHDSAACLVIDGRIVAAAQEERFTRIRHDPAFPYNAAMYCLSRAGLQPAAIDMVVFYEKPLLKLERILQNAVDVAPAGFVPFCRSMPSWFSEKLNLPRILKKELGFRGPLMFAIHHQAHAASAFYPSPFNEAAILTVDGVGEWSTGSIGVGRGNEIELRKETRYPHSPGLLYSAFTEFLGFKVNSDEYKVMGLAPYGEPVFVDAILNEMVHVDEEGGFELNMDFFRFQFGSRTAGPGFSRLAGCPPRKPESRIEQVHMDLARSIQAVIEIIMLRQARFARELTGMNNLCMAGGVALNCVANGKILKERIFDDIWIQPAAGDAGGAVGAALIGWYSTEGASRVVDENDSMQGALLGPEFDVAGIEAALIEAGLPFERCGDDIYRQIAAGLAEGQVIARFSGRMEFGPRALGSRSILADARNPAMQRIVNEKIKFREGFRPFAPAVLLDHADAWFDLDRRSPYMLLVDQVASRQLLDRPAIEASGLDRLKIPMSTIPAVTHVDGSARIQTVEPSTQPDFSRIIDAFWQRTGCPVILNTSFNLRGQPIVCTPSDAVQTFLACDIDALAAGPFMARKPFGWTRRPLPRPTAFRRPRQRGELRRFGIENGIFFGLLGILAWLAPDSPFRLGSFLAWGVSGLALLAGLAAPGILRAPEDRLNRAAARMNGIAGFILFGLVFVLVLTPTALLRRIARAKREPGGWRDFFRDHGGLKNMY